MREGLFSKYDIQVCPRLLGSRYGRGAARTRRYRRREALQYSPELHKVAILTHLQPAGGRPRVAGRGTQTSPAIGNSLTHHAFEPVS
jgi:hypothetical protein